MYKILLFVLLAAIFFGLYAVQMDEEAAVRVFFQLKYGANRAAHAAAQQVDMRSLSEGRIVFDEALSRQMAERYLQHNLSLNEQLAAEENSFLAGKVDVRVFELIDSTYDFPYHYVNADYDYSVTLNRPGVILIIHAEYDRMFRAIGPISWNVKSAAEIVR